MLKSDNEDEMLKSENESEMLKSENEDEKAVFNNCNKTCIPIKSDIETRKKKLNILILKLIHTIMKFLKRKEKYKI